MHNFLIFAFLSLIANLSVAQEIKLGPKLGYNLASQRGDFESVKGVGSLTAGAFVNYRINDKLAVEGQILYNAYGSDVTNTENIEQNINFISINLDSDFEVQNQLDYITVPLFVEYNIYEKEKLSLNANFGPYGSFLVNGQSNYDLNLVAEVNQSLPIGPGGPGGVGGTQVDTAINSTVSDSYKKLDLGVRLGIGVDYQLGPGKLTLDINYAVGLLNIAKDDYIVPVKENENLSSIINTGGGTGNNQTGIWAGATSGNDPFQGYTPDYDATIRNFALNAMLGYSFQL